MPSPVVGVVDYRMGNLHSVMKAFERAGADVRLVTDSASFHGVDALVLPGQGHFGEAMRNLAMNGLVPPIQAHIAAKRPFMGICLGLQVLFESSAEDPETPGLGIFHGKVRRFPEVLEQDGKPCRLLAPAIGWNLVTPVGSGLFESPAYYYFDHSYYVEAAGETAAIVAATTEYGVKYASAVAIDRLIAVQFHPEKSSDDGINLIRRFLRTIC